MDASLTNKAELLAREIATQATTLDDLNGLMRAMMKSALERRLSTELDHHLQQTRTPTPTEPSDLAPAIPTSGPPAKRNRRNGYSKKTVCGDQGEITLDKKGAFHLAADLRAPIVPLFIRIPRPIDPGKGLAARPGTVDVFVGAPIDTSAWRVETIEAHRDAMRAHYIAWHDELMKAEHE